MGAVCYLYVSELGYNALHTIPIIYAIIQLKLPKRNGSFIRKITLLMSDRTFLFQMATLSEEEKEYVIAAFEYLPTSTIDEALINFHKVR